MATLAALAAIALYGVGLITTSTFAGLYQEIVLFVQILRRNIILSAIFDYFLITESAALWEQYGILIAYILVELVVFGHIAHFTKYAIIFENMPSR